MFWPGSIGITPGNFFVMIVLVVLYVPGPVSFSYHKTHHNDEDEQYHYCYQEQNKWGTCH